jgi:hypothetical protein
VLEKHWQLRAFLREKIDAFELEYFSKNRFIIGLQIRSVYLTSKEIEMFFSCAQSIEESYLKENNTSDNRNLIKWFVSADHDRLIKKFSKRFPHRILTSDASGAGKVKHIGFDPAGYERALFDIEMLSKCHETILTGGSTFGFIAALKSQKRSFYVEGGQSMSACKRLSLAKPSVTSKGYAVY